MANPLLSALITPLRTKQDLDDFFADYGRYSEVHSLDEAKENVESLLGLLKEYLPIHLRAICTDQCALCGAWKDEHPKGKCLFDASPYTAEDPSGTCYPYSVSFPHLEKTFQLIVYGGYPHAT